MRTTLAPIALLLVLVCGAARAADVRGTVFDAGNQPLAGATVILMPPGGAAVTTATDANGRYAFARLQAGRYSLVASKAGYTAQRQAVTLSGAAQVLGIYFKLAKWETVARSITGTVFREGGKIPLAGAKVTLKRETMPRQQEDAGEYTTTETGFFAFAELNPGRYLLTARADGTLRSPEKSFVITAETPGRNVEITLSLPPPETVPGTVAVAVTLPDGQPAANTQVGLSLDGQGTATELPWGNEIQQTRWRENRTDEAGRLRLKMDGNIKTDADGGFQITLPAGTWSLKVRLDGHLAQSQSIVVPAGGAAEAVAFALVAGKDAEEPARREPTEEKPAQTTLRGTVLQPDGTPLANAGVYVFISEGGQEGNAWNNDWRSLADVYVVTNVGGGFERKLQWQEWGRSAMVAAKSRGFAECDGVRVDLLKEGVSEVTLKLPGPALTVGGRVVGEDGKPLAGAVVYAYRILGRYQDQNWWDGIGHIWYGNKSDAGPLPFSTPVEKLKSGVVAGMLKHGISYTESGADGRFALAELDGGTYHFAATLPEYARAQRESVLVKAGAVPEVVLTLGRMGSIEGVLAGTDGKPLAAARIGVRRMGAGESDQRPPAPITADAAGRYHFPDVPAGTHRFRFTVAGYPPVMREGVVVQAGRPTPGIDVRLQEGLTLRGKVVKPDGAPAAGALVRVSQGDGAEAVRSDTVAGADGVFTLAGLAAGAGTARASLPDAPAGKAAVTLPQAAGALLEVNLPNPVIVRGTLRDAAGKPVAGARIYCYRMATMPDPDEQNYYDNQTDATGAFRIPGQAPGTVQISANKAGYRAISQVQVLPDAGGEVVLDLKTDVMRYGSARGRVLKADGTPAEKVRVSVWVEDAGVSPAMAETDARGEFQMKQVPAGKANLSVGAALARRPEATAEIREGQETVFPDVKVKPAGIIECVVRGRERVPKEARLMVVPFAEPVDAAGKRVPAATAVRLFAPMLGGLAGPAPKMPHEGEMFYFSPAAAGVAAYPPGTRLAYTLFEMNQEAQGSGDLRTLPAVPPGPCRVSLGLQQMRGGTFALAFQSGVPAEVVVDQKTRVEVEFLDGGTLSGRFAGTAISGEGAMFSVVHRDTWRMAGLGMPGAGGTFSLPHLAPGDYLLVICPAGSAGMLLPFSIRAGETTELTLTPSKGVALRGKVKGVLPKDTCVSAESETSFGGVKVGDDGAFALEHLLPGTYTLRLHAPGEEKILSLAGVKVGDAGAEGVELEWK